MLCASNPAVTAGRRRGAAAHADSLDGAILIQTAFVSRTTAPPTVGPLSSFMDAHVRSLSTGGLLSGLYTVPAIGQTLGTQGILGPYVAIAPGSGGSMMVGLEIRTSTFGRVAVSATASRWWFAVACATVVGAHCDDTAWALDLGPVIWLSASGHPWRLYGTGRFGGLFYSGRDRAVRNPSVGLGLARGGRNAVGFQAEIRYHA